MNLRPSNDSSANLTGAIEPWARGKDSLFGERIYRELLKLARSRLKAFPAEHSLDPPALISELFVRLGKEGLPREFANRRYFYSFALKVMHRVLLDRSRKRSTEKDGGDQLRVPFQQHDGAVTFLPYEDLIDALTRFSEDYPDEAKILDLQVFGGLHVAEIAEVTGTTHIDVKRALSFARAVLRHQLSPAK